VIGAIANPAIAAISPLLAQLQIREPGTETSCVARNGAFCFDWAVDNFDRYTTPLLQHIVLVTISVALGFVIAMGMAVLSHRHHWLQPGFLGATGVLYTVPSLAFFFLLLPITGRGNDTAIIALTAYTLQIIYRNIMAGLANVPPEMKDAARGMGMNERQLLWKVEMPLALPEIIAGLRIATVSTVAIATLAVFAGGDGLGSELYSALQENVFKTGIIIAGGLAILLAITFDLLLLLLQKRLTRWRSGGAKRGPMLDRAPVPEAAT
jgi:osmoprotectant transport system permease protein